MRFLAQLLGAVAIIAVIVGIFILGVKNMNKGKTFKGSLLLIIGSLLLIAFIGFVAVIWGVSKAIA